MMDSMGLGTLVRLYVSAKAGGSCVVLVNVGPRIRQLLGITNLLSVLTDMCEQGVTITVLKHCTNAGRQVDSPPLEKRSVQDDWHVPRA